VVWLRSGVGEPSRFLFWCGRKAKPSKKLALLAIGGAMIVRSVGSGGVVDFVCLRLVVVVGLVVVVFVWIRSADVGYKIWWVDGMTWLEQT
jgi:hypothetical protein